MYVTRPTMFFPKAVAGTVPTEFTDCVSSILINFNRPASVAQLDARLTGDQEVAGSTPSLATCFRGD